MKKKVTSLSVIYNTFSAIIGRLFILHRFTRGATVLSSTNLAANLNANTNCLSTIQSPNNELSYEPIPATYKLNKLLIIHRHGDRTQISRELGSKYPESDSITDIWKSKMPLHNTLKLMLKSASMNANAEINDPNDLHNMLYNGWDKTSYPYAQLTEIGSQQLIEIGRQIRSRYFSSFFSAHNDRKMFCRSTNMCRTIQSLRSLLAGLFDINNLTNNQHYSPSIIIDTRPKVSETMVPQADGPCNALSHRRSLIFPPDLLEQKISGYHSIETKMKNLLGYDKVNWLTVKEVLTCYSVLLYFFIII